MTNPILQQEQDPIQMENDARSFFQRNQTLLIACTKAGKVANRVGRKASARQMIEVTRCIKQLGGYQNFLEFARCFECVTVERDSDEIAIPNAYSAYLTRVLKRAGVEVTKGRSKLDEVM